ncbi:MAG TPA: glycosyltransferase family 2 protein [Coleofasciculaceae cyanobacterium]
MPKISVCIPTHNRSQLLSEAIASVLEQTETDFELIICDDGSTDGTDRLMTQLLQFGDPRIRYIRHAENIGKSNNMRSGFEAATGKYFVKFDDDDRLTPEFLSVTAEILDHSSADFVGTDHWIIDIHNQRDLAASDRNSLHWGRDHLPEGIVPDLLKVVFVQQSFQVGATLFRRRSLLEVGFMRPNLQNCEDNDLFVRLALAGKQGYYWNDRLMEYRVHAEQQGLQRAIPYLKDKLKYLESYRFEDEALEKIRQFRLTETQLLLGLRLINVGEVQAGRSLLRLGKAANPLKAWAGLGLSLLPVPLRDSGFQLLRQVKQ